MGSVAMEDRLTSQIIDEIAKDNPDLLYSIQTEFEQGLCTWRRITYKGLAQAIDRTAWWINEKLSVKKQHVLAYVGQNDLRYVAFTFACIKTGNIALLLSTRNSPEASRHLLLETKCSIFVDGTTNQQMRLTLDALENLCADISLQRWQIGSMDDVFSSVPTQPYPQEIAKSFADAEDLPAIMIHSSGTTGYPKPVVLTHGYLALTTRMHTLPLPPGREISLMVTRFRGQLRFMHGPLFHLVGIACILESIFFQTPFLLAPDRPMTTDIFVQMMAIDPAPTWGLLTPYILEQLSVSESGRKSLAKLSALNYAGAPMSQATGKTLSAILRLQTIIASSETYLTPTLLCEDPADWDYLEWVPSFELRMDDIGGGLWELTLPRPKSRYYHGIFHTRPDLSLYRTGDLFRPHPFKPSLWHYEGRGDDVIVLSNGEKLNPTDAELLIQSHTFVKFAVISGQNRFQVALLIEPEWEQLASDLTLEQLRESITPLIDEANTILPTHGKIFQSHIAFSSREKPFPVSPKGTMRRRDVAKMYQDVIDALYAPYTVEKPQAKALTKPLGSSLAEIELWIQDCLATILVCNAVQVDDDLFSLGMNSLQVVQLVQVIEAAAKDLQSSRSDISWTNSMIYEKPTARQLAKTFYDAISGHNREDDDATISSWSREDQLIHSIWQQAQFLGSGRLTVALTGSTGELGSYLLYSLLQNPSVTQIYCLNRSKDAEARQVSGFEKKKLSSVWLKQSSRVKFWQTDLEKEKLGLDPRKYSILQDVDVIIHNAWSVNFNQPLASFEPQIVGVRRLLNLVETSSCQIDFHFISSISAVLGQAKVPESQILNPIAEALYEPSRAIKQGYAESKAVSEFLCGMASKRLESRIAIHRVGQLGGPSTPDAGMWNPRDWFPSLVRSSRTMKKLPDSLGPLQIDWLPIDTAAKIITEIVESRRKGQCPSLMVYHTCNRKAKSWNNVSDVVAKACNAEIIPLDEWLSNLESHSQSSNPDFSNIPALYLLSFFQMLATGQHRPNPLLSSINSCQHSLTLRNLGPVDRSVVENWLQQLKEWIRSDE